MLIFRFDIRGHDLSISINKTIEKIAARDSKEAVVLFIQLLKLHVFNGVYDLVPDGFIHCDPIFIDSLSFVMLKLELFL